MFELQCGVERTFCALTDMMTPPRMDILGSHRLAFWETHVVLQQDTL